MGDSEIFLRYSWKKKGSWGIFLVKILEESIGSVIVLRYSFRGKEILELGLRYRMKEGRFSVILLHYKFLRGKARFERRIKVIVR